MNCQVYFSRNNRPTQRLQTIFLDVLKFLSVYQPVLKLSLSMRVKRRGVDTIVMLIGISAVSAFGVQTSPKPTLPFNVSELISTKLHYWLTVCLMWSLWYHVYYFDYIETFSTEDAVANLDDIYSILYNTSMRQAPTNEPDH